MRKQPFDAVLMDLQMPVMDGYTAAHLIRELPQGKEIPIIALSAAAMVNDKLACEQAGMTDHVSKPLNPEHLIKTLLKWTKPRQYNNESSGSSKVTAGDRPIQSADLAGFDLSGALARMGGNQAMMNRLLLRFATDYASSASQVDELLHENQADSAANLLHRLKGVSLTLGAVALADAARQLESEIKSGSPVKSSGAFSRCLEETVSAIKHNIHSAEMTEATPRARPDIEAINEGLTSLARCLKNHELPADSQLTHLLNQIAGQVSIRLLSELDRHMQNFDFDWASATVEHILGEWQKNAKVLSV